MPASEKTEIVWAEDSSGRTTCHLNVNGKSLVETYVGEIKWNHQDRKWYALHGNGKKLSLLANLELTGPYRTYRDAQLAVERSVGGVPVED